MVPFIIFLKYQLLKNAMTSYGFMTVLSNLQARCLPVLPNNSLHESLVNLELSGFSSD